MCGLLESDKCSERRKKSRVRGWDVGVHGQWVGAGRSFKLHSQGRPNCKGNIYANI